MLAFLLAVATVICVVNWLAQKLTAMALVWYLVEKNLPVPGDDDLRRCTHLVVKHVIEEITGRK